MLEEYVKQIKNDKITFLVITRTLKGKLTWATSWENLSSGVCDQVRLKPICSATEASKRLEILDI